MHSPAELAHYFRAQALAPLARGKSFDDDPQALHEVLVEIRKRVFPCRCGQRKFLAVHALGALGQLVAFLPPPGTRIDGLFFDGKADGIAIASR